MRHIVALIAAACLLGGCTSASHTVPAPEASSSVAPSGHAATSVSATSASPTPTSASSTPPASVTPPSSRPSAGDQTPVPQADLAGSPWRIPAGHAGGIEGYANRTSVAAGQPVTLFVSTTAPSFRVRVFRMGWYRAEGGRQIWLSPETPGHQQMAPVLYSAATSTITTRWTPSVTIATARWAPGDYLLRLESNTGHESFVPLTVRAASAAGRVVLVNAVTTWQAYNRWGCCSLYAGRGGGFNTRSRAVTFDRPYANGDGAGEFVTRELPMVAEAERLRLPLDYVTDIDLHADPHLLDGARAVISMGHDEYWSPAMRASLTAAVQAGTNLASFGANAIFRRIRLAPTRVGPDRLEINYKSATEDPLAGHDNAQVTSDWPDAPDPQPESSLLGNQYACNLAPARAAGVIVDPHNWLFTGAQVHAGEALPGLVGPESDAVQLKYPTPRPLEVLLHSPTACPGGTPPDADTTYYVAHSGAGVFDAGTIDWVCALGAHCRRGSISGPTQSVVRQVTDNLLRAYVVGPAGRQHPARDNLRALSIAPR